MSPTPARARRAALPLAIPGISERASEGGAGQIARMEAMRPSGFSISAAILASKSFGPRPTEQVREGPISVAMTAFTRRPMASASACSAWASAQTISSMEQTAFTGMNRLDGRDDRPVKRHKRSCRAVTRTRPGHCRRASRTKGAALEPQGFRLPADSDETRMLEATGMTPTGLPRRWGWRCCSALAKNESKST